jgi:hypothetical protein
MKCPEGMEKHIGCRMKKEPELIGGKTCARGAVREQMVLVLLDHKLHSTPAAVDHLIDEPAVPVFQVGDDETGVRSKGVIFDFGNDSSCFQPGYGFIKSLGERFNRFSFPIEPQRGLRDQRPDLSDKGREGLKSQNILHVALFTKIKNRRTGVIGISPHKDAHFRPSLSDFFDHPREDGDDLFACGPLSRWATTNVAKKSPGLASGHG